MSTDQQIEAEIQAKGKTAPRITSADIEAAIDSEHYFSAADGLAGKAHGGLHHTSQHPVDGNDPIVFGNSPLELLTFCVIVLRNGFTGTSACASPENFDAEIGRKVARQDAVRQVWLLLGYQLRERLTLMPKPAATF